MTHATVPEHLRADKSIAYMRPGTSGWAVSWAILIDSEWRCYLNGTYTVKDRPGGTVDTHITREPDGTYTVTTPIPSDGYFPQRQPRRPDDPPIARLIISDERRAA